MKPGILSENLKTLKSSNYPTVQYYLLKLRKVSCLLMSTKGCVGFFLFCLDLELLAKIKKGLVSTHSLFTLLTQDLSKIKISRGRFCRHYYLENVCKILAKNIELYGSWNSSKL